MNAKFYLARLVAKFICKHRIRIACYTDLSLESSLFRLKENALLAVNSVIDVGASDGSWTARLLPFCPAAGYLLVEANRIHEKDLRQFCTEHRNCSFVLAAASDTEGDVYFEAEQKLGGKASHNPVGAAEKIRATTLDAEVAKLKLRPPFLVKLDTHGFETAIFRGAQSVLAQTNVVIVEAYNFNISEESLTFWDMCRHMESSGFRPFDFVSPMHRPWDGALWQCDIVFIRADWPGFSQPVFNRMSGGRAGKAAQA